jgi:hypothetical protein
MEEVDLKNKLCEHNDVGRSSKKWWTFDQFVQNVCTVNSLFLQYDNWTITQCKCQQQAEIQTELTKATDRKVQVREEKFSSLYSVYNKHKKKKCTIRVWNSNKTCANNVTLPLQCAAQREGQSSVGYRNYVFSVKQIFYQDFKVIYFVVLKIYSS